MTIQMTCRQVGAVDVTPHGFRSTFRDWVGDCTSYPNHVAEMALAHTVKGVEGDYRRSDLFRKRRGLMDAWAQFCTKSAARQPDNVVGIRGSK